MGFVLQELAQTFLDIFVELRIFFESFLDIWEISLFTIFVGMPLFDQRLPLQNWKLTMTISILVLPFKTPRQSNFGEELQLHKEATII